MVAWPSLTAIGEVPRAHADALTDLAFSADGAWALLIPSFLLTPFRLLRPTTYCT